ncbi:SdpI family protein [Candidatus Woesearchaeota archaeon]|nr:SdpI family protein [Candidatus Woesearchaeota archaeon]
MKKSRFLIISLILASFIIGGVVYSSMPEKIASHWNAKGEVDGYMNKFWGIFLMPIMLLGIFLLFLAIPYLDPLKKNIEKFRKHFDNFILVMIIFMFYIYLLTVFWNLGYEFNMSLMIMPMIGALFIYISGLLSVAKRNWFIGIRTPWTLSSDAVWDETHKLGSKIFKAIGIIILLSFFVPKYSVIIVLVSALGSALFLVIYSFVLYQKIEKK